MDHVLWFLPLYSCIIPAIFLVRLFYGGSLAEPRLMMGALGLVLLGFVALVPWARFLSRRQDRPRTGPGSGT